MISIIIPAYNAEETLFKCLESILNQTYQDFEVIIVDDGSTDKTRNVVEKFSCKDTRFKYFHKENGGQSSARNLGLEFMLGDYYMYVDSDDYLMPEILEKLYRCSIESNADISMCGMVYKTEHEERNMFCLNNYVVNGTENIVKDYLKQTFAFGPVCKLYKSKYKKIKFVEGIIFEDVEMLSRVYLECNTVACINYPGYVYLVRTGSTTHSKFDEKKLDMLKVVDYVTKSIEMAGYECKQELEMWILNSYITILLMMEEDNCTNQYRNIFEKLSEWICQHKKNIISSDIIPLKLKLYAVILSSNRKIVKRMMIYSRKVIK